MPSASSSAHRSREGSWDMRGKDHAESSKADKRVAKKAAKHAAKRVQAEADKKGKGKAPSKTAKHDKSKRKDASSFQAKVKEEEPRERRATASTSKIAHVVESDSESEQNDRQPQSTKQTPPSTPPQKQKYKRAQSAPLRTPKSEASQRSLPAGTSSAASPAPTPPPLSHAHKMRSEAMRKLHDVHAQQSELEAKLEQLPQQHDVKRQRMRERHAAALEKLERDYHNQLLAIDEQLETLREEEAREQDTIALMSFFRRHESPIVLDSSADTSMAESDADADAEDDDEVESLLLD